MISRRKLLAAAAGATGLAAAARVAQTSGLIPPDHGGLYGVGETLTYGAQKLLTAHSLAREFPRSLISNPPFANEVAPFNEEFKRHQAAGFAGWNLAIDGMVRKPQAFSVADIKALPPASHITELSCEEGWTYIAEWTGARLSDVLEAVGVRPEARYAVYFSIEKGWWDSVDMAEALHPQTLVAYGLNGGDLPVGIGGPLRMRVPRQLGYKSVKYITRVTLTGDLKRFGKGLGSAPPEGGYSWYAGI
jgi:DMSO/TMAO reductase YedYZ molybdopterin-dependent catalytic subunit